MVVEIIDLTKSPPPPNSSKAPRIINFNPPSVEKIQFEKAPMQLMAHTANPNLHHTITSQLQTSLWPASVCTYESSQIATRFKPSIGPVTTVLEPVPESNTHLFPHGARLKDSWTQKEHEFVTFNL
ncbi:hypothetical protein VNO77_02349 [Canavalia gladiata]|uniref:Uncharacterized protein n=1 Tax=Canavalia gladiata TaxID=3824 RepID=A0AAN9R5U9_CANGL